MRKTDIDDDDSLKLFRIIKKYKLEVKRKFQGEISTTF